MGHERVRYEPVRLSHAWRRGLVCVGAAAAAAAITGETWTGVAPSFTMAARIVSASVGVTVLWILADVLRPWVVDRREVGLAEVGQADRSVQQAYGALFAVALGLMLFRLLAGPWLSPASSLPFWPCLWTVILLPVVIAAWTAPDDLSAGTPVGPLRLVLARLRGEGALPYRLSMAGGAKCLCLPLVAFARAMGLPAFLSRGLLLFAVTLTVIGGVLFLRALLEHSLDRSDRQDR